MTSSHPSPGGESSKNLDDGGPALPCEIGFGSIDRNMHQTSNTVAQWYGMTLRDYFATHEPIDPNESIGVALAEQLAGRPHPAPAGLKSATPLDVAQFWADAEAAYRYMRADAMLKARSS